MLPAPDPTPPDAGDLPDLASEKRAGRIILAIVMVGMAAQVAWAMFVELWAGGNGP